MKILAIRGANLASLEGEFALELAEGPLARAGVFAICGPTGAGKSTLLDAMCLALFDTAPRLSGSSRVRVGREEEDEADRLTTTDPRSILRKGAGAGFAEVDFLGVDGRRYRARWEAHRARGRAGGKLQATTMSLADLEDERTVAADRKTDVKRAIEERLGLTFDQFRRSVLLAQGDFAAFLDADAKERAGLLERMTGTEIYGRISVEAHERARVERALTEQLMERSQLVSLLSDEERAEHEGRLVGLTLRAKEDELRMRDAERVLRWHALLEGLRREEQLAREEHEAVERQLALAESKRQQVAAYEEALPVRPLLEAADRAAALAAAREVELGRAAEERGAAERQGGLAREAHAAATRAVEEAERALADAGPALGQARLLDRETSALAVELEAREEQRARRASDVAEREGRLASAVEEAERARGQAEAARAWLDAHAGAEPIARRWDRMEARLSRVLELSAEARTLAEKKAAAASGLEEVRARRDAAITAASEAERARTSAELALAEALAAARAAPSEALSEVRSRWVGRRTSLETMIGVSELAQRSHDALRRQRDRAELAARGADAAEQEAREAAMARDVARERLDEAMRARDQLRSTLDLTDRRAELREGEPCPLCGATDHPYARQHPAVERLIDAQDARVRELAAEVSRLEARVADALRAVEQHREAERVASEEAAEWAAELARARGRYADAAAALSDSGAAWPDQLPSAPRPAADWGPLFASAAGEADGPLLDAAARDALLAARDEAAQALSSLDEEERARRLRERAVEARREAFERARELAAKASEEARSFGEACAATERELERRAGELSAVEERAGALVEELTPELGAWPRWREALREDGGAFAEALRLEVEAWLAQATTLDAASARARELAPALEAAREQLASARRELEEASAERERVDATLREKRLERAALFGGAGADAHEAGLRAAVDAARTRASEALRSLEAATRALAEASSREARAIEARREAAEEAERARVGLARALREAGLEEAEARARLAHDAAAIEGFRRELAALDGERARLATVLAERARKREAHATTEAPRQSAEEATRAMGAAEQRAKETGELAMAVRHRLARDDEQRREAAELAAELEAQKARLGVWETLSDLIGSANGAKLRVFAQSLTLELLLEHANHHLAELAPRYSLSRVPGEDLALMVVDHEMGDEVRSVGSLSGGESFLVALGMALGLASLSSSRARVGSLFIDEGFGALDPASLDLVLSTLDVLQATGRQVGLISHVPTIAERFDTRVSVVTAGPARSRVELVEGA